MVLAFAQGAKSIDADIVEEAAQDLDLNRVQAELYQTEPPLLVSSGKGKVQTIRGPKLPDPDNTRLATVQGPIVPPLGMLRGAGASTPVARSSDTKRADAEDIPPLLAVIPQINWAEEKQSIRVATPAEGLRHCRSKAAHLWQFRTTIRRAWNQH